MALILAPFQKLLSRRNLIAPQALQRSIDNRPISALTQICRISKLSGNSPAPAFPRIGGQHEDYLLQALQQYKKGTRKNAIMAAQVGALSDQDMADLAAYFASQAGPLVTRR